MEVHVAKEKEEQDDPRKLRRRTAGDQVTEGALDLRLKFSQVGNV